MEEQDKENGRKEKVTDRVNGKGTERDEKGETRVCVGGNLTLTHKVDPRGETFHVRPREGPRQGDRWEVWWSCKKRGRDEAGRLACEYFLEALKGQGGERIEEKNDYQYLREVLGEVSWEVG